MSREYPRYDFDYSKDLYINVDTNIDFYTDVNLDVEVYIDAEVYSCVHIDGNLATLTLDAEAIGYDTLVTVDASVLTVENQLSSVTLAVTSAAN